MAAGLRTLVDCSVLSLQDFCVFYPSCKSCFSRIDVQQQEDTARCSKCGCCCVRGQVDYRYRLSLRVTRDTKIFGVTVFGNCLNPFFGIPANGLQRLVENMDGPAGASTRSSLLVKAVKDCFIGKRFIFGIKVAETECGSWLGGHSLNGSSSKDTVQFIASQMILPKAPGQGGCSVINYYQILLQKTAEYETESTDPSKTYGFPEITALMIPLHQSPAKSLKNASLSTSGFLVERSQHTDCGLAATPLWNQSLGLITSSAEQEESSHTLDSGMENSKQSGCLENHEMLSPLLSLDSSSYNGLFANYPYLSIDKAVGNTPILNTWFRLGDLPPKSKAKGFFTRTFSETYLSNSVVLEDLPLSESLSEFVCEENKDFDRMITDLHLHMKNHIGTARKYLRISPQDKKLSVESIFACQNNANMTERHCNEVSDISNITNSGSDGHDLSDQADQEQASNMCSDECDLEDENAISLFVDNDEERQLEEDVFNFSADLFSSSTTDMNTKIRLDKQELKSNKPIRDRTATADMTQCDYLQPLDFIPSSQSTPIVKVCSASGSHRKLRLGELNSQSDLKDLCAFYRNLPESVSKTPARITSFSCKLNHFIADQHGGISTKENSVFGLTSSRCRFSQKRKFWKPDQYEHQPQHLRIQRAALNTAFRGMTNCKCDSSVCDYEDNEGIVPPTPAAKKQVRMEARSKRLTDDSSCTLGWRCEEDQQADGGSKKSLFNQTLKPSARSCVFLQPCDGESAGFDNLITADVDGVKSYQLDDENEACDWSRDLFF